MAMSPALPFRAMAQDAVKKLSKKETKILTDDLEEKFKDAKAHREPLERVWLTNIAFYEGKQWHQWADAQKALLPPDIPSYRVLPVINMVKPTIRTEYAKLIQNRPTAYIQPSIDEPGPVKQARAMTKVLAYMEEITGAQAADKRALLWSLICGTGIEKYYWDKSRGPVISDPERGLEGMPLGEVCVSHVTPFEFYPERDGETIDEKNWVFQVKIRSREYVQEKYGRDDIPETEFEANDSLDGRIASLLDMAPQEARKGVVLKEFHQRPTRKHPRGRFIEYAGDLLLGAAEHPYPNIWLPFTSWQHIPVPGRFWGDSLILDLIDPQRNYNKSRGQAVELRNLMAKNKWLVPSGSLLPGKTITSAPGEVIDYIPIAGMKPEPIAGKDVPVTFWRDLQQTKDEVMEVTGQHEVSRSQVPGQVKAGVAIQALQEQDDARLTPTSQAFEDAVRDGRKMMLKLAKQYYQEMRVAKIIGKHKQTEIIEFRAEDIPDDVDVRIQAGSSLPKSKVARHQLLLDYFEKGLIPDPKIVLRLAEFDQVEGVFDELDRDTAQAERENEAMKMGEEKMANDWDNHPVHIFEHNKFRKSEEFEQLDENVKAVFQAHMDTHQMALAQQALTQPQVGPDGQPIAAIGQGGGAGTATPAAF